jgi:hypothetical protein
MVCVHPFADLRPHWAKTTRDGSLKNNFDHDTFFTFFFVCTGG